MKKGIAVLIILTILSAVFFTSCEKVPNDDTTDPSTDPPTTESTTDTYPPLPDPVTYNTEVILAGRADEVVDKIEELNRANDGTLLNPCAFVVNSAENLSAINQLRWTNDTADIDIQLYDEEFFKSSCVLVTAFWTTHGFKFSVTINKYDNQVIIIDKVQTNPKWSDEDSAFKTIDNLMIAYNIIPISYNNQSISYIESQLP